MIDPKTAGDIAQYVRSLSGLTADPVRVFRGKREFANYCVACHGVDGKGNQSLGAPNLTDEVWLYGSSEATIVQTILEGRQNRMPAHEDVLTPDQIKILTAWVWGLSNKPDAKPQAAEKTAALIADLYGIEPERNGVSLRRRDLMSTEQQMKMTPRRARVCFAPRGGAFHPGAARQ